MDSPGLQPESPMEQDEIVYPCKGCGDILEEGKAFELAGNRWHIDCFRCNTCGTLLDSDANLLLLGDGSLICNNCTYSCNACGNKIEDLAILTGDQAFCASCFRCRNCKRKIENLRYARTSQGIFCMSCHETLMARRRKKTRTAAHQPRPGGSNSQSPILLDKSLPSLPPNAVPPSSAFSPNQDITPSEMTFSETPTELSPRPRGPNVRHDSSRSLKDNPHIAEYSKDNLILPSTTYQSKRTSSLQDSRVSSDAARNDDASEPFSFIPLAFDPSPAPGPSPMVQNQSIGSLDGSRDYFNRPTKAGSMNQLQERRAPSPAGLLRDQHSRPASRGGSTQGASEKSGQPPSEVIEATRNKERIRGDVFPISTPDSATFSPAPSRENTRIQHTTTPSGGKYGGLDNREHFRLQEVPPSKKSGASSRSTKSGDQSPDPSSVYNASSNSAKSGTLPVPDDGQFQARGTESSQTLQPLKMNGTPRASQDSRRRGDQSTDSAQSSISSQLFQKPKREDSLAQQPLLVKNEEPILSPSAGQETPKRHQASSSTSSHMTLDSSNRPTPRESPRSSSLDRHMSSVPSRRPAPQNVADSFTSPRAPPPPPPAAQANHQQSLSMSSAHPSESSRNSDTVATLPQYTTSGDLSMDDDLARILAGSNNDSSSTSLLRRVSSAVRHGRSFSDMTTRTGSSPKWPKSPTNGAGQHHYGHDISSPTSSNTTDLKEENSVLRHELRRKSQRIAELEARMNNSVDMKKLDTNIREKRSTVAFLDTQKELMVRELEILTEHVAAAKKSGKPLNMESLKSEVLRDFAMSLQELKDTYGPEIEDLIHQKNQLMEEVANLGRLRDQAIQETEQLNSKNSQLADLNNELTNQIQERYKANRDQVMVSSVDSPRHGSNGLGIYHHKERSDVSMDGRELRPPTGVGGGGSVASLPGDQSDDPTAVLTAPHIVNIRKGQAKKFNWKKGSQSVAKGVSKGFKGAFSSSNQNQQYQREGSVTDAGVPYGSLPTDPPSGNLPRSNTTSDLSQPSFKLFSAQKLQKAMPSKSQSNGNLTAAAESPSTLFGSALDQRAEYEKRQIPSVVTRCIEEVELRGMDLEGIYRKVGGNSQVKAIQEGFERSDDFDISDPTMDISAVTSVLKQYFRKLPIPLLTFDIYDKILESNSIYDEEERARFLKAAIEQLPPSHRYCLEFLVFHLARVAQRDKENLMNPKNLAVVFAPTIMRDHSLAREMTDMHSKNTAIQFMIENNKLIFGGS